MRDLVTWLAVNGANFPDPTLAPSFLHYIDRSGSPRAQPAIINFGLGVFGFIPSDTDVAIGTVYVIDNGAAAAAPLRYEYGAIHEQADQLQPLLLLATADYSLWTGAAATVGAYRNDAGGAVTPPAVRALVSTYLQVIQPTVGDSALGVHYRCDAPVGATFAGDTLYVVGNFFSPNTIADKVTWLALDSSGNPDAAATPTLPVYASRTGTAIAPPAVLNVGLGLFAINPPAVDNTTGVVFLVDNGAGRVNRYVSGVSTSSTDAFDQVLLLDPDTGVLWAGAPPSFSLFKDSASNGRLRPTPVAVAGGYLFTLLPSAADLAIGVAWAVDGGGTSIPNRLVGNFVSVPPLLASAAIAGSIAVASPLQSFAVQQDFGIDISTYPDLDASFALLQGNRVLMENVVRRWTCGQGALLDAPDYGIDVRQYLNDAGQMGNIGKTVLSRMKTAMENEAKRDTRVANCIVDLQWNQATQAVVARAELDAAGGPFKLELAVTAVTVSLLSLG